MNLNITPRVTYQDEIILQLTVENSGLGQNVNVAGTLAAELRRRVARRPSSACATASRTCSPAS